MYETSRMVTEIGSILGCINDSNSGPSCCLANVHDSFTESELDNCVSILVS
jgi:hypothetical protein